MCIRDRAMSVIGAKSLGLDDLQIISSGGVKNSLDIVKSIVIGADMVAISGEILSYLVHGGYEYTMQYLAGLIYKTKIVMTLTGAKNIEELKESKYLITGKLQDLLCGCESK